MSRDVDRRRYIIGGGGAQTMATTTTTTSINSINVSRCLATSIDVDTLYVGGGAQTRATTTTSINSINVSRCLATSIDVDTVTCRRMGADQGDDDDDDVDKFYQCLSMSRDVDRRRYMYRIGGAQTMATTTTTTSINSINVSGCLATSIDVDTCRRMGADQGDDDDDDVDKFYPMSLDVSRRR